MTARLQQHETVPAYTRNLASQDEIKWSAEFEVPAIGEDIAIRLNGIGRAKVVGYATYCGYLGVMTVPYSPPQWWVWQNGMPGCTTRRWFLGRRSRRCLLRRWQRHCDEPS
uniref:Uncharacterized protein n=1 Tax=Variovorax paradoxus (strain S110) TaxID=543728 RepID=C5CKG9_VARPS